MRKARVSSERLLPIQPPLLLVLDIEIQADNQILRLVHTDVNLMSQ
jgi:hypothetical protein